MKMLAQFAIFSLIFQAISSIPIGNKLGGGNGTLPQQIHLALGNDITKIVVTWNTILPTVETTAIYSSSEHTRTRTGYMQMFSNGPNHIQYVHRVVMDNLSPNTTYHYEVGDGKSGVMSKMFTFTTLPSSENWPVRFCVYGDLGYSNPQSLSRIQNDVVNNMYDAILHVGDFGYNLDSNFGDIGDKFMNLIQPIAANIPYMTTPGNHENAKNFSNYKNRFTMPNNNNQGMFYSYNVGQVHIISISTEFYFYVYYGIVQIFNQYEWLIQDLKTANLPENRAKQPWIVVLGHRPLYCSNNGSDCTYGASWLRHGIPGLHLLGLEDPLYEYGVDVAIWAHEHSYERMWPVYNSRVVNSSTTGQPYHDPKAPLHIVSGSAGCDEDHDPFPPRISSKYSAFHSTDYGYSRMTVFNSTHLLFQQISDDKKGAIIDEVLLYKSKHGSYL